MTDKKLEFKHAHITGQVMRDHWGPIVERIADEIADPRNAFINELITENERLRDLLCKLIWSDCYGIKDDMMANGCGHGFKPASSCPNAGCKKGELEREIDAALREQSK